MDSRLGDLRSQAESAMAAHNFARAADAFRLLIVELNHAAGPFDHETLLARYKLGVCMMETQQWNEAAGLFRELASTFERRGLTRLSLESSGNLAACLANTGDHSSAARIFEYQAEFLSRTRPFAS